MNPRFSFYKMFVHHFQQVGWVWRTSMKYIKSIRWAPETKMRTTSSLRRSKTFRVLPPPTHCVKLAWTPGRRPLFRRGVVLHLMVSILSMAICCKRLGTVEEINWRISRRQYIKRLLYGMMIRVLACIGWRYWRLFQYLSPMDLLSGDLIFIAWDCSRFWKTPATDSRQGMHLATLQRTRL